MLTQCIALGVIADPGGLQFMPKEALSLILKVKLDVVKVMQLFTLSLYKLQAKIMAIDNIAPCHLLWVYAAFIILFSFGSILLPYTKYVIKLWA